MVIFTFDDLQELRNQENDLLNREKMTEQVELSPSTVSVNNILNYSKALSIRKSKSLKEVKMILN